MSRAKPTKRAAVDMEALVGRFNDAIAVVECASMALESAEIENPATHVLGLGLGQLRAVYTQLETKGVEHG
jgi:hypothetical protein